MWPNPQKTVDLVTFTEEILNGKLHFLCSEWYWWGMNWESWKERKQKKINTNKKMTAKQARQKQMQTKQNKQTNKQKIK